LRLGELLALRWTDVDLAGAAGGALHVRGTLQRTRDGATIAEPKTTRSRRRVELSALAADALRRHRVVQNEERLRLGRGWHDLDLVFPDKRGNYLSDTHLRRRSFGPLLARAGLPPIRFHDLRHSAATLLLGQGTHPKIVSEMLGHSTISITLDLYSHVTPTMQRQAAAAMDTVLGAR
jgi:integrase